MKVKCPYHEDHTPSLHIYENGVHCFVCGTSATLTQYRKDIGQGVEAGVILSPPPPPKPKEDIKASLARIEALPKMQIRGLNLHADEEGYYVVWPNKEYYLYRHFNGPTRYIGPSGHRRPFLHLGLGGPYLIVEGEINALSVMSLGLKYGVGSPGAANQMRDAAKYMPCIFAPVGGYILIADEDVPGAKACIETSLVLADMGVKSRCVLMKKQKHGGRGDANEILVSEGPLALRQEIQRLVGE